MDQRCGRATKANKRKQDKGRGELIKKLLIQYKISPAKSKSQE
jgi:hypothetical protein